MIYICILCGFSYDPAKGLPGFGIQPDTPLDAVPADWRCPECGAGKECFNTISLDAVIE